MLLTVEGVDHLHTHIHAHTSGEDASPFPVKLRSVADRGGRGDSSNLDSDRSLFPAVKLKSITKPGDKGHDDVQAVPFGEVICVMCMYVCIYMT
jgi:hypothetical protein